MEKVQPLVSVGMPTYNNPKGLERALKLITAQTYANIEIIISDNGSATDETELLAKEFQKNDPRIRFFKHTQNGGAVFNFKFVLQNAEGEYFFWAADDDEWTDNFIEECVKQSKNGSSVFCGYYNKNRVKNILIPHYPPKLDPGFSKFDNLKRFLLSMTPSMIYGLHHTNSLKELYLNYEPFDWYDCHLIMNIIVNKGFFTLPDQFLYTSGIDNETYIPKPFVPKKGRLFHYRPFFFKTHKLIFSQKELSLKQKLKLMHMVTVFVINAFCQWEGNYRKFQTGVVHFFLRSYNFTRHLLKSNKETLV